MPSVPAPPPTYTSSDDESWSAFMPSDRLPLNLSSSLLRLLLRSRSLEVERRGLGRPNRSLSGDLGEHSQESQSARGSLLTPLVSDPESERFWGLVLSLSPSSQRRAAPSSRRGAGLASRRHRPSPEWRAADPASHWARVPRPSDHVRARAFPEGGTNTEYYCEVSVLPHGAATCPRATALNRTQYQDWRVRLGSDAR